VDLSVEVLFGNIHQFRRGGLCKEALDLAVIRHREYHRGMSSSVRKAFVVQRLNSAEALHGALDWYIPIMRRARVEARSCIHDPWVVAHRPAVVHQDPDNAYQYS
jgi:hypothetical protein